MIPYTLIIPSASRPHLLDTVLKTFFEHADQLPVQLILHDDAVFPRKQDLIREVIEARTPKSVPFTYGNDDPPIKHGPTIHWLLKQVTTKYVLYTQDDHQIVRDLPISRALALLDRYQLNQIRFNKRDTLDKKGREGEEFYKVESAFSDDPAASERLWKTQRSSELPDWHCGEAGCDGHGHRVTLCAADHWYFQTGVWRVAAIKPVVDWWATEGGTYGAFAEHCEVKINQVMNGQWQKLISFPPPVPCCDPAQWNDPSIRATVHKTFIWGKIGEPRFVDHIGFKPEDWALERANRDPQSKQV